MLDRGDDYVPAVRSESLARSLNREVIRLSPTGSEDNLVAARPNQSSDLPASFIDRGPRLLPKHMDTGSVPKILGQVGEHRFEDAGINRRRRTVIEINSAHKGIACSTWGRRRILQLPPANAHQRLDCWAAGVVVNCARC